MKVKSKSFYFPLDFIPSALDNNFIWDSSEQVSNMDNEYYLSWGTLALINAGLAQGKNRGGLNWFLLLLLLGLIATFIVVCVDKKQSRPNKRNKIWHDD